MDDTKDDVLLAQMDAMFKKFERTITIRMAIFFIMLFILIIIDYFLEKY